VVTSWFFQHARMYLTTRCMSCEVPAGGVFVTSDGVRVFWLKPQSAWRAESQYQYGLSYSQPIITNAAIDRISALWLIRRLRKPSTQKAFAVGGRGEKEKNNNIIIILGRARVTHDLQVISRRLTEQGQLQAQCLFH